MKNYFAGPDRVDVVVPTATAGGTPLKIGQLLGVLAESTTGTNEDGVLVTTGQFEALPAATGEVWAAGDLVYWDDTGGEFTTTASGNLLAGHAVAAKLSAAAVGNVRLDGVARPDEA